MVKIATYTQQQGLETDARGMPHVRADGAASMGSAVSRLGQSLAGVGNDFAGLAAHMEQRAEQDRNFKAGVEDDTRRQELAGLYQEHQRKAAADGTGFHDTFLQEADKLSQKRFENISDPILREKYQARWQAERQGWQNKASEFEVQQRGGYQRTKLGELQNGLVAEIGNNPDPATADAIYQRGLERINSASALTNAEKMQLAKQWEQTARTAELQKRFAADPDGMRAALGIISAPGGKPVPDEIRNVISQAAEKHGVPVAALLYTADRESKFNPQAKNPNSSAAGLFQFINSTRRDYGNFDPYDPVASSDAAARLMKDNQSYLRKELGRDPTNGELYLAHQQGAAGAAKILKNPDARVEDIVGVEAARLNGGAGMTAGQFAQKWTQGDKYASLDQPVKERLVRQADNEARTENVKLQNLMVDDINSIRSTGQPIANLDVAQIEARLGKDKAQEHIRERNRESRFFEATRDFDTLPNDAILARVNEMRPKGGTIGFTEEQKNYEEIEKRGRKVIENRLADPAASVDNMDAVREARKGLKYEGEGDQRRIAPDSAQAIIRARIAQQEALGIERPFAVTKREASTLARQLRQIGEDNEDGIQQFLGAINRTYGGFAPAVLQSVLEHENVNRDLSTAATRVLTDIMRAKIPDISSIRKMDANIAWGIDEGSALAGMGGQKAKEPPGATFDKQDLKWLYENRMDPTAKEEFNLKYPGQADRVLQDLERRMNPKAKR